MKKFLALTMASAMALSLAACGGAASSSTAESTSTATSTDAATTDTGAADTAASNGATEITLWHYFENEGDYLNQVIDDYNKSQDKIHITPTFMSREELMNQYTIGAVSGELPDIGMVDSPDMASYIELGVFEDVTDELNSWGQLDKFYPGPLSSCQDADGKYYGLPQNSNCLALAVNMDLLKAAGYDDVPTNIDDFKKMVEATTDQANSVYGFAMCCVSNEEGTFQELPWLLGTHDGKKGTLSDVTDPNCAVGLDILGDFVKNGNMSTEVVNWTQSDALNEWMNGKSCFLEAGTWQLFNLKETPVSFNYKFCLLPTGDDGTSTSTIGGENFGICAGCKDKAACTEFLEYFMSAEQNAKWASENGKMPVRSDAKATYEFEQDNFAVFQDEMNYALARGPHAEWPSISEAVYTAFQSVLVDGQSGSDALGTAAATIKPILDKNPLPQ
jgi:multiple sugar transport system substrate-binding protein